MNGRVYDPGLGRFLSVDPVFQFPTNTQSLNPYTYVLNSPLALTDPTGLTSEDAAATTGEDPAPNSSGGRPRNAAAQENQDGRDERRARHLAATGGGSMKIKVVNGEAYVANGSGPSSASGSSSSSVGTKSANSRPEALGSPATRSQSSLDGGWAGSGSPPPVIDPPDLNERLVLDPMEVRPPSTNGYTMVDWKTGIDPVPIPRETAPAALMVALGPLVWFLEGEGVAAVGFAAKLKRLRDATQHTRQSRNGPRVTEHRTGPSGQSSEHFDGMGPKNVRSVRNPEGTETGRVGDLPGGRTINQHRSSTTGQQTIEILDPAAQQSLKIRYPEGG